MTDAADMHSVVIGAGAAGSVIARRMSESDAQRVTLIEAGPDYPPEVELPGDLTDGGRNSMKAHDWGYRHLPTPGQFRFPFPRGRVVGGSSAVNTCIALRGQPYDYDEWGGRGLSDWSWRQCLPAFKRLERDLDFDDEWHGTTGPLPVRRHRAEELTRWQAAFVEACVHLGYPRCPDSNHPTLTGAGPHAMNKVEGRRISAAQAFLTREVRDRENFELLSDTLVRRVIFEGRRATGVEIEDRGGVRQIAADVVVVSTGAINTPGVLMRSGVGPRADLERLGVEVVANNPAVGARLLDHPGTALFFRPRRGVMSRSDPLIQTVLRLEPPSGGRPNEVLIQPGSAVPLPWITLPMVSIMCSIGKPRGAGTLRYESADPRARPVIESKLLLDAHDRRLAVELLQHILEIARQPPLQELATLAWPRPRVMRKRESIDAALHRLCDSGYHPSGTVPMGADEDLHAATDGRGRVRGVERLVVADASLMPTIPTANIHLATLMIGERFGEWLRDGEIV